MVVVRDLFFLISISILVSSGVAIALRSGLIATNGHRGCLLLGNLSKLLAALIGCGVVLAMIHDWMGYRWNMML